MVEDRKRVLIFAGCNDKKLISKVSPILDVPAVERVYLVRMDAMDFTHPKLTQYPVVPFIKKILPFRELYRVLVGIYLILTKRINLVIGIRFLMHGIYTVLLSKLLRIKYILLFIESPSKYEGSNFFLKAISSASAIGVRGSSSERFFIDKGIPKEKIFTPPNEFTLPKIERLQDRKEYDLIYIGNFIEIKDLPLWIEIFKSVKKQREDITGVMLGDGNLFESIKSLAHREGVYDNIDFVGRKKDVYEYINRSKILLMTSKLEGLPMVAVECMSVGVPAVLPDVGDVKDLIKDGENGVVISSRNSEEYTKAILELLSDKKRYSEMSNRAIESIKIFSEVSSHENIVQIWTKLLEKID